MNPRRLSYTCLVMLVLFAAPVVGQQTPEELLQSALSPYGIGQSFLPAALMKTDSRKFIEGSGIRRL